MEPCARHGVLFVYGGLDEQVPNFKSGLLAKFQVVWVVASDCVASASAT